MEGKGLIMCKCGVFCPMHSTILHAISYIYMTFLNMHTSNSTELGRLDIICIPVCMSWAEVYTCRGTTNATRIYLTSECELS